MENFRRFSRIFLEFSRIFLEFSAIFLEFPAIFLENFPKIFAIFFEFYDFSTIFSTIFPKILAHNPLRFNRGLAIIVSLQVSL